MGPLWRGARCGGPAFPHILYFSSSLKFLDNSILCKCPELFCRCELPQDHLQKDNVNYSIIWSTHSQASWSLRRIGCETSCYLTINQSEGCAQADLRHCLHTRPPHLAFKRDLLGFAETFWGAQGILGHEPPFCLHGLQETLLCSRLQHFCFFGLTVWELALTDLE